MLSSEIAYVIVTCTAVLGLVFGIINILLLFKVPVGEDGDFHKNDKKYLESLIGRKIENGEDAGPYFDTWDEVVFSLNNIAAAISDGASAFLWEEYKILALFMVVFGIVLALVVEQEIGMFYTTAAFFLGGITSIASGYIGMRVAVYANSRTAYSAINKEKGLATAFVVAFRGGSVLGFCLTSLGLINLMILIWVYEYLWDGDQLKLFECIAGYGLGGSTIALFGRVGGGIYTKAADVGADLAGKVEEGLEEDDPRNPATIADNVGDNVGDIAGMGSDLFGSFAESTCAALVLAATSDEILNTDGAIYFPLLITAIGIPISLITALFATNIMTVDSPRKIERTLKYQLLISTVLMTPAVYFLADQALPEDFSFRGSLETINCKNWYAFVCVATGLWTGLIVGFVTEYFTSHAYKPVRDVANACRTGAATDIIYGLALGYLSCVIPTICLAITIFVAFSLCGMFGIALAALGMLSNLCTALAIDGYGPISDNAGGMVEMIHLHSDIRKRTDALDAAGNTTAAIGKGFAIGSAALVSLALFGAFITRVKLSSVNILSPLIFAGLLFGAMLPYAFSALTMKSVGKAAQEMVEEVRRQFSEMRKNPSYAPEYQRCIQISTRAALKEMILPGLIVILTPILVGLFLGPKAVAGVLAGILVSGVQMATSSANSGGAWDNAKKYIESEALVPKSHPQFKEIKAAAVTGDTVGDPMKDTSGPSLNILVKLSAIISLVFGDFFISEMAGLLFKIGF